MNIIKTSPLKIFSVALAIFYVTFLLNIGVVSADYQSDFNAVFKGSSFYDPESGECVADNKFVTDSSTNTVTPGSATYIVGDSIAYGLFLGGAIESEITNAIGGEVFVNYDGGRSITGPGTQPGTAEHLTPHQNALEAVDRDKDFIKDAGQVVIVLGTNNLDEDFSKEQSNLIDKIKGHNPGVALFWVDIGANAENILDEDNNVVVANTDEGWSARNEIIHSNSSLGYTVISQYQAIFGLDADPLNIDSSLPHPGGDGIHGGYPDTAQAITDTLKNFSGDPTQAQNPEDVQLPLREQIAQMLIARAENQSDIDGLAAENLGGFYVRETGSLMNNFEITTARSKFKTPPIIGTDQEGGEVNAMFKSGVSTRDWPSALAMGALPTEEVKQIGSDVGLEMKNLGIDLNFAPVLDLHNPDDAIIGSIGRGFSGDPNIVVEKAGAFMEGQESQGIDSVIKHFPGHGNSTGDTHLGTASAPDFETLKENDLKPFIALLPTAKAVMMSHLLTPGLDADTPASISPKVISYLRNDLNYNGIIMTDDLSGMKAITDNYTSAEALELAITAGEDMLLVNATLDIPGTITALEEKANADQAFKARIEESSRRVAYLKSGVNPVNTGVEGECFCGEPTLSGDDNVAKIWNFFIGKGLEDYLVAGILANMESESGGTFEPRLVQYGHENSRGEISVAGQPSSLDDDPLNIPGGRTGYGIVQFTPATKLGAFDDISGQPNTLQFQLDYIWRQFESNESAALEALLASTNALEATAAFMLEYERPADQSAAAVAARAENAEKYLLMASSGGLSAPSASGSTTATTLQSPVIVLDPGHSPSHIEENREGLVLVDGVPNSVEMEEMFKVAQKAKTGLETLGYRVVMTKDSASTDIGLGARADIANNNNAALAVSIHSQGNLAFGTWQEIYPQKVGLFREQGTTKKEFTNAEVAASSQQYSQNFKGAWDSRSDITGTVIKDNSFDGRAGLSGGNLAHVQLFSNSPWVYLEAGGGANNEGLTEEQEQTYADVIIEGVQASVNSDGSGLSNYDASCADTTRLRGDVVATALEYAWPEHKGRGFVERKPEYAAAIESARGAGQYVGGIDYPGVDCGGFTTRVMIDSGFEPGFNFAGVTANGASNTQYGQLPWAFENMELIGVVNSTAELQPGDVAFHVLADEVTDAGHTFMYVGSQPGFETEIASSSMDNRAPMAGKESIGPKAYNGNTVIWFRIK